MGKVVGFGLVILVVLAAVFGMGFSTGLDWGGDSGKYINKDAPLSQTLSDEQLDAVRIRVRECLPISYESYLDACLNGSEKDWKWEDHQNEKPVK